MNRRKWLKSGIALLGCAALPGRGEPDRPQPGALRRQLRFALTFTNPKPWALRDQVLWLYGPATTATQKPGIVSASAPCELSADRLGHTLLKIGFPRIPPLASKTLNLAVEVLISDSPDPAPLANPAEWLGTERYIETEDPGIKSLAAQLRQATDFATARAIYDWLRDGLRYSGYRAEDLGAREALRLRQGDCTEFAYLAVALARANGIPARMVGGYVAERDAAPRAADYHNWAELHVGGAWCLLDAQKGNWLEPARHYLAFRLYRDEVLNPIGRAHRFKIEGDLVPT